MNEDRKRILAMLAESKINADEAERLLSAMDRTTDAGAPTSTRSTGGPKYFRVDVDAKDGKDGPTKINIRVPIQILRAGVRLSSMIPARARDKVNAAMAREGIDFDINQLKPENLEDLIDQLGDFTVDVDSDDAKVRVYCE